MRVALTLSLLLVSRLIFVGRSNAQNSLTESRQEIQGVTQMVTAADEFVRTPRLNHPRIKMTLEEAYKFLEWKSAGFWVLQALSWLAVLGNVIVIAVIPRYDKIGVPHVYMLGLGFCDLLIGVSNAWKGLAERLNYLSKTFYLFCSYTYRPIREGGGGWSVSLPLLPL